MKEVIFPLRLVDEEGCIEYFEDIADLECNLEDFDSKRDTEFELTDAKNRPVNLRISTTFIEWLNLEPFGNNLNESEKNGEVREVKSPSHLEGKK